jgi:small subunit ribosomal protein S7
MARRKAATKRVILPDPLYNSEVLAKFINVVMRAGKKSIAEKVVYGALDFVVERVKKDKHHEQGAAAQTKKTAGKPQAKVSNVKHSDALAILEEALSNVAPKVEVKSRRVGGATYQVPLEVDHARGLALAMRWVVKAAKARSDKTMILKLAAEIVDAYKKTGAAIKIREDMHRMAKANQAFAHYRW